MILRFFNWLYKEANKFDRKLTKGDIFVRHYNHKDLTRTYYVFVSKHVTQMNIDDYSYNINSNILLEIKILNSYDQTIQHIYETILNNEYELKYINDDSLNEILCQCTMLESYYMHEFYSAICDQIIEDNI